MPAAKRGTTEPSILRKSPSTTLVMVKEMDFTLSDASEVSAVVEENSAVVTLPSVSEKETVLPVPVKDGSALFGVMVTVAVNEGTLVSSPSEVPPLSTIEVKETVRVFAVAVGSVEVESKVIPSINVWVLASVSLVVVMVTVAVVELLVTTAE